MVLELDYFEYTTDLAAQTAYVSSDAVGESIDQQQTTITSGEGIGDVAGIEYREAQSFQLSAQKTIAAVEIRRWSNPGEGSPTGNWTLRIETDNSGEPSGTLANVSASVVVIPPAISTNVKGAFATPFSLSASTPYWLVVQCDNQANNNYWYLARGGADYANGTLKRSTNGIWGSLGDLDLYFKIYVQTIHLQCYSESTIKQQGSYSLKVLAAQTDSLNNTLTKSGLSVDLSSKSELNIDIRANRTGTNLQVCLYDSVGGWITKDTNIISADVFQTTTWDISGISDANKSNITKIKFKILNADSETIYYIDNFYEGYIPTYRISRNVEASIIQFLREESDVCWSNVGIEKTFARIYKIELPSLCVRCRDSIHPKVEVGSDSTIREIHVVIDLFCTSDGQRLDLKDFLIEKLKHGIPYYEYTIVNGAIQSKILNGRLTTLEMDESPVNFDTDKSDLDLHDRYRHLITLRLSRGKIEV